MIDNIMFPGPVLSFDVYEDGSRNAHMMAGRGFAIDSSRFVRRLRRSAKRWNYFA